MYLRRNNMGQGSFSDYGNAHNRVRAPTPIRQGRNTIKDVDKENRFDANQFQRKLEEDKVRKQRKPLITPDRNPFKNLKQSVSSPNPCYNHPEIPSTFIFQFQDQIINYCSRCAVQMASQGLDVVRDSATTAKKPFSKPSPPSSFAPLAPLISSFLEDLAEVEQNHCKNVQFLSEISSNYEQQIQWTKEFYQGVVGVVEAMRDDHLADLEELARKHSQIGDIEEDYLRQNLEEMQCMKRIFEEGVFEDMSYDEGMDLLNECKRKIQVYKFKTEEQEEFFNQVINFSPEQYQSKLSRVQDFLMQVWQTSQLPSQSLLPLQVPQNIPKTHNQPPAFRKLFQEQQIFSVQISPQFKRF